MTGPQPKRFPYISAADTYIALLLTPPEGPVLPPSGGPVVLSGRFVSLSRWVEGGDTLVLDTNASRITWHSVTGLVIGAIGIGVWVIVPRITASPSP